MRVKSTNTPQPVRGPGRMLSGSRYGRRKRSNSTRDSLLPRRHPLAQLARRFQQLHRHLVTFDHTGLLGQTRQQIVVDSACQAGWPPEFKGNLVHALPGNRVSTSALVVSTCSCPTTGRRRPVAIPQASQGAPPCTNPAKRKTWRRNRTVRALRYEAVCLGC